VMVVIRVQVLFLREWKSKKKRKSLFAHASTQKMLHYVTAAIKTSKLEHLIKTLLLS